MKEKKILVSIVTNCIAWLISIICLVPLLLIDILNDYGYEDQDYYFEDNIYEKRINELNWRFGFEFDERKKYLSRYNNLKEKNMTLNGELQTLMNKNKKLKAENDVLRKKNKNLKKENETLESKYNEIVNSNSWKITEPLRKLKNKNRRKSK